MNTYLVTVTYAGAWEDFYIAAASPEQAVEIMREKLLPKFRRWANVFVG